MSAPEAAVLARRPATERPAHRDPNVLRWLAAYVASLLGDTVYFVALSWAATQSGGPSQVGLVLAIGAVPRAVLMLGGGVVADRLGPRRVVIGSDLVRCVVILAAAGLLAFTAPGLWALAAIALVFGAVDALFMPAVGALPPRITAPGQLARVQGMRGMASRTALIAGAPLGGMAVAFGGSAAAFAVAGAFFAGSLALLLAVRVAPLPTDAIGEAVTGKAATTPWRDLADGLRYIRRHRLLAPLVVAMAVGELGFTGPMNVGLALLVQERGWGASGLGWIIAGFGLGAGGAALLVAVRRRLGRAGLLFSCFMAAGAVAVAALAYVPTLAAAVAAGVAVGLTAGLSGTLNNALIQTEADPAHLGRVTSVAMLFTVGTAPLAYPLTGAAVGVWGPAPVFAASAAVIVTGAAIGLLTPPLRRAELPS
ncbi:MFS transporter [Streptomyces sp. NPDC057654]|uniref:MFS transporter n=1 Tax=Streptomyces sp. NPDC057654 TaxID=3346196 RepID=UPI0036B7A678